jgi:hypothetical protein
MGLRALIIILKACVPSASVSMSRFEAQAITTVYAFCDQTTQYLLAEPDPPAAGYVNLPPTFQMVP